MLIERAATEIVRTLWIDTPHTHAQWQDAVRYVSETITSCLPAPTAPITPDTLDAALTRRQPDPPSPSWWQRFWR